MHLNVIGIRIGNIEHSVRDEQLQKLRGGGGTFQLSPAGGFISGLSPGGAARIFLGGGYSSDAISASNKYFFFII